MFTNFTLKQGGAIVTSLEHLLFEFLNQIPDGIKKFNETEGKLNLSLMVKNIKIENL